MAERTRKSKTRKQLKWLLTSGAAAVKGEVACYNTTTGNIDVVGGENKVAFGYFLDSLTGDGVLKVRVELFDELKLHALRNDDTHPVLATDAICWLKDGATVSGDPSTNRAVAGYPFELSGNYVYFLPADARFAPRNQEAGSGVSVSVDHADTTPVTVMAAADYDRVIAVEAKCTETIAGDDAPTFALGIDGTTSLVATAAEHAAVGTAGDRKVFMAVLPAGEDLIATLATGGTTTNDAGAFTYTVMAVKEG